MKSFTKLAVIALLTLSPGLANQVRAEDAAAPPAAPTAGAHHHHGGKALHKAMKAAFASCKSAGVDGKACAQQLETYLSDFKPSK